MLYVRIIVYLVAPILLSYLWTLWIWRPLLVRHAIQQPQNHFADMPTVPVILPPSALEDYNRKGYVVVRGAFPRKVVEDLYSTITEAFPRKPAKWQDELGQWIFHELAPWVDYDAVADFVFHHAPTIGGLAAQLTNASTIRYGAEAFKGISAGQSGHQPHFDIYYQFFWPELLVKTSPKEFPLVRLFMPLGSDIIANETGGSLFILPFDEYATKVGSNVSSACYQKFIFDAKCKAELVSLLTFAPDLNLGDLILYSPHLLHQTQPIIHGERVSYVANLYDPVLLQEFISIPALPYFHQLFCEPCCFDASIGAYEYNFYWQSKDMLGISKGASACNPQIYPNILAEELRRRQLGQIHTFKSNRLGKKDRVRRYRECFPLNLSLG